MSSFLLSARFGHSLLPNKQQRAPRQAPRPQIVCSASTQPTPPSPQAACYPGFEEEYEVSHSAFHKAFEDAKPPRLRIPGLQEFAAAMWGRRHIPSSSYQDPLLHIFDEFDVDNDGQLNAREIAKALRSRGVSVSTDQIKWFIAAFADGEADPSRPKAITRSDWSKFVFSLAVADLRAKDQYHDPSENSSTLDSADLV